MEAGGGYLGYLDMLQWRQVLSVALLCIFLSVDDDGSCKISVDLDAVTKANHFRNCGAATKGIGPNITGNYGEAEAEVRALDGAGLLNLNSYVDTFDDPSPVDNDNNRDCSSSLHCARPEAPAASGPCDVHGIVGGVCSHGFPLKGLFMDMHGPEQFVYYLILLKCLIKSCPAVSDVYVDFACRLKITWQRFITKQGHKFFSSEAEYAAAKDLRLLVNWMHGSSHDLSCQLRNNGRYTANAGHKHGEGSEQLWSQVKVCLNALMGAQELDRFQICQVGHS